MPRRFPDSISGSSSEAGAVHLSPTRRREEEEEEEEEGRYDLERCDKEFDEKEFEEAIKVIEKEDQETQKENEQVKEQVKELVKPIPPPKSKKSVKKKKKKIVKKPARTDLPSPQPPTKRTRLDAEDYAIFKLYLRKFLIPQDDDEQGK